MDIPKFYVRIRLIMYINIGNKRILFSKNHLKDNNKIFKIIKNGLYNIISKKFNKNITHIDELFINGQKRFGNFLISLNHAIIFCEYLCCKRIVLGTLPNIYIKNKIFYRKYNLTIESSNISTYNNNSLIANINFFYYYLNFKLLGNVNRFYILRKEILNNLPKVKIHPDDLFLYIRGGDIFINPISKYAQPPLCFYETILNQFNFRKVIIISEDKLSPIISILLKKYSYIKYKKNYIKLDISVLTNSYNIVSAKSSFIISIIKLNDNLKFLWEYDFYPLSERYRHLHYSVYTFTFKYIIYKMTASEIYKKLMIPFIHSEKQKMLMIKEKCDINFNIIPSRIS